MSPWHWAIVLIVLVLLFGSTRLPGAARGLGKSLRIFKSEMKEMTGDEPSDGQPAPSNGSDSGRTTTPQALPPQQPSTPAQPSVQAEAPSPAAATGNEGSAPAGTGGGTPQTQSPQQQSADRSQSAQNPQA